MSALVATGVARVKAGSGRAFLAGSCPQQRQQLQQLNTKVGGCSVWL